VQQVSELVLQAPALSLYPPIMKQHALKLKPLSPEMVVSHLNIKDISILLSNSNMDKKNIGVPLAYSMPPSQYINNRSPPLQHMQSPVALAPNRQPML
jgi:hypothetical protein